MYTTLPKNNTVSKIVLCTHMPKCTRSELIQAVIGGSNEFSLKCLLLIKGTLEKKWRRAPPK